MSWFFLLLHWPSWKLFYLRNQHVLANLGALIYKMLSLCLSQHNLKLWSKLTFCFWYILCRICSQEFLAITSLLTVRVPSHLFDSEHWRLKWKFILFCTCFLRVGLTLNMSNAFAVIVNLHNSPKFTRITRCWVRICLAFGIISITKEKWSYFVHNFGFIYVFNLFNGL